MKRRLPYVPAALFLVATAVGAALMIPRQAAVVAGFLGFLVGYSVTYRAGVRETQKNSYAVLRLRKVTPFVMPMVFFLGPTLVFSALTMPRTATHIVSFSACLVFAVMAYAAGMWLTVRGLAGSYRGAAPPAPPRPGARRLVLVNPVSQARPGLTINQSSTFPPLGLGVVGALTPACYDVTLIDENIAPFVYTDADLVGITAFTSSAPRAYEIAREYRSKGVPVIMGGIHCSMRSEEALEVVDAVVVGEAETVWGRVIDDFERGKLQRVYRGEQGGLAGAVTPRRDLFSPEYVFATIQTSRGCPLDCSFCSVTSFNGRRYRQRPAEEVLAELERIENPFVFFVDDNILGYGPEAEARATAIFRGMVERRMNKSWFCQASLNFGSNDEALHWAAKSGCKMVFIGLESSDPVELEEMHKNLNLKLDYRQAFAKIHRHGIAVLGAFIFGSETETVEAMQRKIHYINHESIDVVQTTILTPLPGTRLFEQYEREGRLKYPVGPESWEHFDMSKLTYRHAQMSEPDFLGALAAGGRCIYSRPSLLWKFFRTWKATRSLETAFWAYNSNMNYRAVARAQASLS